MNVQLKPLGRIYPANASVFTPGWCSSYKNGKPFFSPQIKVEILTRGLEWVDFEEISFDTQEEATMRADVILRAALNIVLREV